ncbi:retrovirus-related Pol polyprotein from transposon gypsy [Trichonephila clavipes]|nr:retrovirus-related Pol polyprotein from transposon gypsy [Trichonephila clavipes]
MVANSGATLIMFWNLSLNATKNSSYKGTDSVIAAPLTDLLKGRNRKSTVDWNSSCQNAFEELKTRLSKNPVLYSPDFTKPFIIQCDASNLGIGVVLSQVCENEEHPIMFLNKKLSLAEQKYSTTDKECAAIIFAVQKLKCYLDGHQKFVIQTDHNPLVWRVVTSDSQARCTAIYHTCYEMKNELWAQTVPSFLESSLQFCNGAWRVRKGCNLSPEHIPYMLDRISIRGVRRPRHALDVFRFKEVINQHRLVTWRIIIHEYEVRTDSTSKQANIRLKNFISVSLRSQRNGGLCGRPTTLDGK